MASPTAKTQLIDLAKTDLAADARKHDPSALQILIHDMEKQGQLQEIIVEKNGGRFTVIAGVGRTLAAKKLGWKEIRASVCENVSPFDKARITFAENEDREDVDPFYQAYQLNKMMKAKSCTQQVLAKELGISDSLISSYQVIDRLPEELKTNSRRLELGLLIQIARLNGAKSQIRMAEKCVKMDTSVRQLKGWVDRKLGIEQKVLPIRRRPEELPDPMRKVWDTLSARVSPENYWEIEYGTHRMHTGQKVNGWYFFVMPHEDNFHEGLARWFGQMSASLGEGGRVGKVGTVGKVRKVSKVGKVAEVVSDIRGGEAIAEPPVIRQAQEMNAAVGETIGEIRYPKNAAEERELEQVALRGTPKDVYAWIYGADSPMTKIVPFETWKDFGMSPKEGLQKILEGIKEFSEKYGS